MSKKPSPSIGTELKNFVAPFRVDGSGTFHLKSVKTNEKGGLDKDEAEKILDANRSRLKDFQEKLYAQDRWSLLLIFQGMDAAGKDSVIKSIFDGVNPQGCEVHSFKQPSTLELNHDFMWRSMVALPRARPHRHLQPLLLRGMPGDAGASGAARAGKDPPELVTRNIWRERFEDIPAIERYLARNGTVILKFFLNVSREEQRERFLDRLDEPSKNWKFSMSDISERALWPRYRRCIRTSCGTPRARWRPGSWCRPITNGSRAW